MCTFQAGDLRTLVLSDRKIHFDPSLLSTAKIGHSEEKSGLFSERESLIDAGIRPLR